MKKSVKIIFHNGDPNDRPIVTMSYLVNNGKRFDALDEKGKASLVSSIKLFQRNLDELKQRLIPPTITTTNLPGINPDEVIPSEPDKRKLQTDLSNKQP